MMGDITDDGLTARFLVAHCERSENGSERAPNKVALGTYENIIKALVELQPKGGQDTFVFSEQALKYRLAVRDIAQSIQLLPGTSDALKAHLNKWEAAFCRMALIYHLIEAVSAGEYPRREIPEPAAKMAATLMTVFLLPNSIRFYTETIDDGSQIKEARWVAGYILSEGAKTIKKRDLLRNHKSFANNPKLLSSTMSTLYAANWVNEVEFKGDGSVIKWAINPKVHSEFARRAEEERKRRADERAKIQQAVERIRKAGRK
jgi:hypothetical protein